jgi:hypothetical protein
MTGTIFLAAFLGCLLAIEAHTLFVRTVIEPFERRQAVKKLPSTTLAVPAEMAPSVRRMLDADQALKIAALDWGEGKTGTKIDENLDRLKNAALDFAHVIPEENKARIRDAHAFQIEVTK